MGARASLASINLGQQPAFAERRFEIVVRFGVVDEAPLGCVPIEFAVDAQRDYA